MQDGWHSVNIYPSLVEDERVVDGDCLKYFSVDTGKARSRAIKAVRGSQKVNRDKIQSRAGAAWKSLVATEKAKSGKLDPVIMDDKTAGHCPAAQKIIQCWLGSLAGKTAIAEGLKRNASQRRRPESLKTAVNFLIWAA